MSVKKYMLAADSSYATPYYVIKGKKSGPKVMVVSGIHGDEVASILAAQRLVHLFSTKQKKIHKGTLIIVPIVNKRAYIQLTRGEEVDLNRTFPCFPNQKTSHHLSAALFQLTKHHKPAWYLDLHEAHGLSQLNRERLGQTLITNPGNRCIPKVRRIIKQLNGTITPYSNHFNLKVQELPGSSRTAAARILKSQAVTVESSRSLKRTLRMNYHSDIVCRFLKLSGLLR